MPYCSLTDIQTKRIPEDDLIALTDDADLGTVDQAVVDGIIAGADELIDGYLRVRHSLPLVSVPGLLAGLSADITTYRLYGRRPSSDTPERIVADYKTALKQLENIQQGKILLDIAQPTQEEIVGTLQVGTGIRQFGADTLDRY